MKYKKYPSYKDSGVEWLGEIPEHWLKLSLKQLVEIKDGTHDTPKYVEPSDKSFPLVTSKDTTSGEISFSKTKHISEADYISINRRSNVEKGDIIMPMIGSVGSPVLVDTTKAFSIKNVALFKTSRSNIFASYLCYYMDSHAINIQFALESRGGVQDFVSLGLLQNVFAFKIPLLEQQQIAKFLDNATQKMDTLIQKQENLIKLLKEKRQAVISHAVTRGLNPDVKFKDSGVEWLGEVPEHWEVKPAQYIAKITRGAILRPVDAPEYFEDNGEWAYLNISDATKCDKYLSDSKLKLSKLGSLKSARVYPNNVIITASATIGKAFINKIKVCVHDGFIPFTEIKVYKDYLYHYLSNPFLYAAMGKSNTQKNIYLDEVKRMLITVPPMDEQVKIVDYLEEKSLQMNILIKKATKSIKLLKEKRTALISAAVTGKIDVRELV